MLAGETADWDTAATSVLPSRTEATRAVRRTAPVEPRQPVGERRRPAAAAAREAPAPASRRRGLGRLVILLLILVLIGAGVGIAVASSLSGQQKVQLREVVYNDVGQAVDAMKKLVEDNTQ